MIIAPENVNKSNWTLKFKWQPIEIMKKKKILGIIVDEELQFEDHIASRASKL